MRLATVCFERRPRLAAVADDGTSVALLPDSLGTLDDVVRGGPRLLGSVRAATESAAARPLRREELMAPIQRFNRDLLCIGWNYREHFTEGIGRRQGQEPDGFPNHPTFFTKAPGTVIGPYDEIAFDPVLSAEWDYEAEVAVVIGRDGRSIPAERAMEHVFGYCIANDVSQRDIQRAHGGQWMKGKSIDATMPLGPWLTTADELPDPYDLTIQCDVNGVRLQDGSTCQMAFPIETIIAELSWGMTLRAGDVVLTGTPSGVGNARDPKVFLAAGDVLVTRVSRLGELRNLVKQTVLS